MHTGHKHVLAHQCSLDHSLLVPLLLGSVLCLPAEATESYAGKPLPPQPSAPETLGVDKSKTPQWEVVVNVHSISLIMEKLPPFDYEALGSGPDLGTVGTLCDAAHLL